MQEPSLSVQNCQPYDLKDWHASAQDIQNLIESSVVGLFPGSVILLGGAPGAGEKYLITSSDNFVVRSISPVCMSPGEESLEQIALRAQRLGLNGDQLECVSETRVEAIAAMVEQVKPSLIVVDSVQVMQVESLSGAPGSVGQVRESAAQLTRLAKATGVIVLLVGHVTKGRRSRPALKSSNISLMLRFFSRATVADVFGPCARTRTALVRLVNLVCLP
jgi:predicted ATP-dependent serine protease